MMRLMCLCVLLACVVSGCAAKEEAIAPLTASRHVDNDGDDNDWSPDESDPSVNAMFRKIADAAVGTPYTRGGTTMSGFDCSGFVQWTYKNMGVSVPRTAREQSEFGQVVSYSDLRIGDVVTFRHPRRGWHTGIYMGNDQFVHSPSRRKTVRYSSLSDPYFRDTYIGARRIVTDKEVDMDDVNRKLAVAEAEKRYMPDRSDRDDTPRRSAKKSSKQAVASKASKKAVAAKSSGKQAVAEKKATAGKPAGKTAAKTVAKATDKGKTAGAKIAVAAKGSASSKVKADTGKAKAAAGKTQVNAGTAKTDKAVAKTAAKSGKSPVLKKG